MYAKSGYLIENISLRQIATRTIKPPAALPCTTRPIISILMLLATAQTREPMKNTKTAARRMGFRPQISLNFPQRGVEAAFARR